MHEQFNRAYLKLTASGKNSDVKQTTAQFFNCLEPP